MKHNKVYCCNCKFYVEPQPYWGGDYCSKKKGEHDEAYSVVNDRMYNNYETANENNNCKSYKRKWWKFWIKK